MDAAAKLITSIAALLAAIAWPVVAFLVGWIFRQEIRLAISKLPNLIDRMRKMKIAGLEAELDRVADAVPINSSGQVTESEVETAVKIAVDADEYNIDLSKQLDRLCLEYDSLRRTMHPGPDRTRAMTRVLVRMRALAPSLINVISAYKSSASPGSRLAAVAMMQMNPNACDIDWLAERFEKESPFIFYHSALALQNLANNPLTSEEWDQLLGAAQRGLDTVKAFQGVPDVATIEVLEALISDIRQQ